MPSPAPPDRSARLAVDTRPHRPGFGRLRGLDCVVALHSPVGNECPFGRSRDLGRGGGNGLVRPGRRRGALAQGIYHPRPAVSCVAHRTLLSRRFGVSRGSNGEWRDLERRESDGASRVGWGGAW